MFKLGVYMLLQFKNLTIRNAHIKDTDILTL